ncbi:hypothetical protein BZM27_05765 [Paraburkholderia steynii]|uniref:Uncharacterized protein n=1 Tax=Paraburkholderia steynii TaxID=1245441 RepID=A0A4R0XP33_9BURK|nr:hypothetical protein BZM27_05765 [Paraburkholderia steynii]
MTYDEADALIREHIDYGGGLDVHALAVAIAGASQPAFDAGTLGLDAPRRCQSCGNSVAPGMDADHEDWCELLGWKKRAIEAEELNRKFMASVNGPTHMGEPALPRASDADIEDGELIADLVEQNRTLREALEDIAKQDPVEMALDPGWAGRVARIALTAFPAKETP